MDWSYFCKWLFLLSQFYVLSVAKREKKVAKREKCNNFIFLKQTQLNEKFIEELGRSDGIKSTLHCQERTFYGVEMKSVSFECSN